MAPKARRGRWCHCRWLLLAAPALKCAFQASPAPKSSRRALLGLLAVLPAAKAPAPARAQAAGDVLPPWAAAFSGAVQGVAQNVAKQVILHPFDTVKTRLQAGGISRQDLFQDVYRGLLPTLVSGTPGSATFFAAKEAAQSLLKEAPKPLRTSAGVVAGVLFAKAVKTPFDVAETKAMASVSTGEALAWDGSWQKLAETFQQEGFAGLYRGYGANVLYKLPADLAKFLSYEALRGSGAAGAMAPGLAGAVATLASNAITTPLDVVRTQAMVQGSKGSKNALERFQDLIDSGDSEKIWSGFGWRLGRGLVAGAIQFTVLENTKDAVEGRR